MKHATEMKKGYNIVKRIEKDLLQLNELRCVGYEQKEFYSNILTWITDKKEFYSKFK